MGPARLGRVRSGAAGRVDGAVGGEGAVGALQQAQRRRRIFWATKLPRSQAFTWKAIATGNGGIEVEGVQQYALEVRMQDKQAA